MLWEVGEGGTDLRSLRERLHLDSGYLSRIVRRLEADGLVTVDPRPPTTGVRPVRVTAAGRAERAGLDRDSDALAWSLLAPLDPDRRARLVEAMGTVERLLTAGLVDVRVEEPTTRRGPVLHRVVPRRDRRAVRGGLRPRPHRHGRPGGV